MQVAIIGFGYWGPNLVRNFSSVNNCNVKYVVDGNIERLQKCKQQFPLVHISQNFSDVLSDTAVEAVIIATPVHTHYELAKHALENNKHVLVEKPLTSSIAESEELIVLAKTKGKLLMVDHTFLYTGAVRKAKELVSKLGKLNYFDSTRINLGLIQSDINVLWDLAPHDISILRYLVEEMPYSINATGISHTNNGIENIAYLTLNFKSGLIAHFNCSWTSPVKIRTILIGGSEKMVVYNDMEPTEKIKIYDTGFSYTNDEEKQKILVDYRTGDIHTPKLDTTEALTLMANDFINSIKNNTQPISNASIGLDVVKILSAAQESIKNSGKEILIK